MKFHATIVVEFEAASKVLAETEAKRIYAGVDDVVAEQNDPKNTAISVLLTSPEGELIRTITVERR